MKKKAIFCLLLCFVMLTPVVALAAGENQQAAENILQNSMATTFAVIHTGDTNGVMENKDGAVGFAKVAGLADQTVEDYETLLLDSGNALTGDGGKNIKVMNAAGYTAAAIGTRDAALGVDRLQSLSAMADFPLLCANWLKMDGDLFFDPYAVIDVGNVRVGIIGLITPDIAEQYPDITEGCNVYKPSAIANIYYDEMQEAGCNYYIALTSFGYDGSYTPRDLGKDCPWLNLILDSNTGEALELGELVDGTNVIAFDLPTDFAAVGRLIVTTGTVSGQNTTLPEELTVNDLKSVKASKTVQQVVDTPESELFPVQETESTEETAQPAQTSVGIHLSSQTIFMLSFAAIVVVVVVIILVMSRKKAGPKKKD